jgi:hypothetical protein
MPPQGMKDDVLALEQVSFAPHPVHKVPTLFFQIVRVDSGQRVGEINLRLESNLLSSAMPGTSASTSTLHIAAITTQHVRCVC